MSNIGHLIACDEVFNSPNGELILKQPLNSIMALSLPTYYSFVIAVGLINLEPQKYKAIVKLISPSKDVVATHNLEFLIENSSDGPINSDGGFNVNFRNVVITEEGNHIISVQLNEEEKTLIIPVIKKVT